MRFCGSPRKELESARFTTWYPEDVIAPENPQSACDGYRFGRFEIWTRNGLLLRDEKRIRIEELPFQLLLVLLESPGEVVSKETLRTRLWSDRTFGELDNGLHVATAKLREALGEKAGAARYIETVRGRGYRFNGEVELLFSSATGAASSRKAPLRPLPPPRICQSSSKRRALAARVLSQPQPFLFSSCSRSQPARSCFTCTGAAR